MVDSDEAMPDGPVEDSPEPMGETLTARCTASEKRDVIMVAAFENTTVSQLLRIRSVTEILDEAARLRSTRQAQVTS